MSFVTVKYADNQCEIFNPNCKNGVLLYHIKQRCGLPETCYIELSDERGYVKQLHYNLDDYATDYLRERENLILLQINGVMSEEEVNMLTDDDITYTPLLDALIQDPSFLGQLNPTANSRKKRRNMKNNSNGPNKKDKNKSKAPSVVAQN